MVYILAIYQTRCIATNLPREGIIHSKTHNGNYTAYPANATLADILCYSFGFLLLIDDIASLLALVFKLPGVVTADAEAVVVLVVVVEDAEADAVELLLDFRPAGLSTLPSSGKSSS